MEPMRRRGGPLVVGFAAALACLSGGRARGQPAPGRAAACGRIDAEIALSVRERVAGRTAAALAVLEDLHGRCPMPQVTAQLALAEIDAQQLQRAWGHLTNVLAEIDDPWARSRRAALIVARTELRARMGSLLVRGQPAGAEVFLDGRRVGTLPLGEASVLAPGTYRVEVRAPGHAPSSQSVTLRAGQDLELPLSPAPVVVQTAAPAPTLPAPLPPAPPSASTPPPRTTRIVGYTLLGLGAASLVASTVMTYLSAAQADALRGATAASDGPEGAFVRFVSQPGYTATDRSTATACDRAARDGSPDGRTAADLCADNARTRTLAWVLGAASLVTAGVGTALVLLGGREAPRAARLRVSPMILGGSGVVFDGAF